MSDTILDRLVERLDATGRSSLDLAELPRFLREQGLLPPPLTLLEEWIAADARFRVLESGPLLPDLMTCTPPERAAYVEAFRRAGLLPVRVLVLVARRSDDPAAPLVDMVRETLARLVPHGMAAADAIPLAGPAHRALVALTAAGAADRSTSRPGDPPPGPRSRG